ncbi:MAG: hypothetical protein ACJAWV_003185 [Flammeovirgaceae bacterium]|jgi:hypothetical protein
MVIFLSIKYQVVGIKIKKEKNLGVVYIYFPNLEKSEWFRKLNLIKNSVRVLNPNRVKLLTKYKVSSSL